MQVETALVWATSCGDSPSRWKQLRVFGKKLCLFACFLVCLLAVICSLIISISLSDGKACLPSFLVGFHGCKSCCQVACGDKSRIIGFPLLSVCHFLFIAKLFRDTDGMVSSSLL